MPCPFAERALTLARERGQGGYEAWVFHLLGEIASHRDPSDAGAESQYRHPRTASELDMRPLVAHCHHGLGKLYHGVGKRREAHEHLTAATSMYREMDMRFWPAPPARDARRRPSVRRLAFHPELHRFPWRA